MWEAIGDFPGSGGGPLEGTIPVSNGTRKLITGGKGYMRKRILSMLAALSLAITLLPATALAANDGKIDVQNSTFRGIQASDFSPALDEVQGTDWTTQGGL